MKHRLSITLLAIAVLVGPALLGCNAFFVPTSTAATTPSPGSTMDTQSLAELHAVSTGTPSENWAGYIVQGVSGAVSDVSAQWIVPSVTCGSDKTYAAIWIGIDGSSDRTVEQIGTEQDCENGQALYYPWFEMYPRPPSNLLKLPIEPGHVMKAEVKYTGSDQFTMTLTDVTTGQNFSTTRTDRGARRRSAEWIVEAPASRHILPLANFDTVQITDAATTLNGRAGTITDTSWLHKAMIMATTKGTLKAQPTTLTSDGGGFEVIWRSS
jgi:hypothetical protein